jgi:hypothetical protein
LKLSQRFRLNRTQFELDFVDIDPEADLPLFLDPYFLATRQDQFSIRANRTIDSYFQRLIDLLIAGQDEEARRLFDYLREPNETCLGLSRGRPRGAGVGSGNADAIFNSIRESRALQTGLLEHLEDCRLFVPGVDRDKVSDMTTNIIRRHLIDYTKAQCKLWNIPLRDGVATGHYWSHERLRWENDFDEMLIVDERQILLVPKGVVSFAKEYSAGQYHQHFVLNFLQHDHLRRQTNLVRRTRNRRGEVIRERVYKKDIEAHEAPLEKDFLARFAEQHREVLDMFRSTPRKRLKSVTNENLDPTSTLEDVVARLIDVLTTIHAGNAEATTYHRVAAAILEIVFYPKLICPHIEREINEGRKRIDLTFDNANEPGFFDNVAVRHNIPCPYILVECKNYGREVGNPEIDQLLGRFHPNRGRFGLLTCRTIQDKDTLIARCRDAHHAQQGLVLPLEDADLVAMLEDVRARTADPGERLLSDRLRDVALA